MDPILSSCERPQRKFIIVSVIYPDTERLVLNHGPPLRVYNTNLIQTVAGQGGMVIL
jgi:hypothetical protein